MAKLPKTFFAQAKSWMTKHQSHGSHAFLRFVMLVFVERLSQVSEDFVFKGGNLLWIYIKTPRPTIDVDFATKSLDSDVEVRKALEAACSQGDSSIIFQIKSFRPVGQAGAKGAAVSMLYRTAEGQENSFDLDVVYAVQTLTRQLPSTINHDVLVNVATMENIVADKLAASERFKGGNTRMKDFDDLWRISRTVPSPIDWAILRQVLAERGIVSALDHGWLNQQMLRRWASHRSRSKGLAEELAMAFDAINSWLSERLGDE